MHATDDSSTDGARVGVLGMVSLSLRLESRESEAAPRGFALTGKTLVHVLEEKIGSSTASPAHNRVGGHHGRECARGGAAGARAYPVGRCGEKRLTRGLGEVAVAMLIATRVPVHV
jgi:hypothetical protein